MPSTLLPDEITIHVEPIDIKIGAKWNKKEPSGYISEWTIGRNSTKGHIMAVEMKSGEQGQATVTWKDAQGNVGVPATPPWWESTDPAIVSVLSNSQDGATATVTSAGPLGTAQVIAHTGANSEIKAVLDVTVEAGEIVSGTIEYTPQGGGGPLGR